MIRHSIIRTFAISLYLICACGFSAAYATAVDSAGKIIASDGVVNAQNLKSEKRPLKRGDDFYVEDTILTAEKSTVSLRFTDGTLLELKENSNFIIKEYQFEHKTPESDSYSAELVKGGFRTITGALGKRNPDQYEVKARMTTLTIRGTELVMNIVPDPSSVGGIMGQLNVQVGLLEGAAVVSSGGNSIDLTPNTNAVVNAMGAISRSPGVPDSMMDGYSSQSIKQLIQQSIEAGYPPSGVSTVPADQTTLIEGEGTTKKPAPIGGSSPCEGVSSMSGAMP